MAARTGGPPYPPNPNRRLDRAVWFGDEDDWGAVVVYNLQSGPHMQLVASREDGEARVKYYREVRRVPATLYLPIKEERPIRVCDLDAREEATGGE